MKGYKGGQCWRKNSRCTNRQPVSDVVGQYPWMEGAASAFKHHFHTTYFGQQELAPFWSKSIFLFVPFKFATQN